MSILFTPDAVLPEKIQSLGSIKGLFGTLTVAGSYVTGGEIITVSGTSQSFDKLLKMTGLGRVLLVVGARGAVGDWDQTNLKLKFWASPGVELAAAAYPAGLTATPFQVMVLGR